MSQQPQRIDQTLHWITLPIIAATVITIPILSWQVPLALGCLAFILALAGSISGIFTASSTQPAIASTPQPELSEQASHKPDLLEQDMSSDTATEPELTEQASEELETTTEDTVVSTEVCSDDQTEAAAELEEPVPEAPAEEPIDLSSLVLVMEHLAVGNFSDPVSGPEKFSELIEAIDSCRSTLGQKLKGMSDNAEHMCISCETLTTVLDMLKDAASDANSASETVNNSSQAVSGHVSNVATAMEEMTSCIREISKNTTAVSDVASSAVSEAESAGGTVARLNESAQRISTVVTLISDIADTTRLLALNAAIEAVRAGEAGKGFSVVASEVKDLARQTADATEQISTTITAITADCEAVNSAIGNVEETIGKIHSMSTTVASAVEEQSVTTTEVNQSLHEAALGVQQITDSIINIGSSIQMISSCSNEALGASQILEAIAKGQESELSDCTYPTDIEQEAPGAIMV